MLKEENKISAAGIGGNIKRPYLLACRCVHVFTINSIILSNMSYGQELTWFQQRRGMEWQVVEVCSLKLKTLHPECSGEIGRGIL